ncbi:hypothetical protein [Peristeroidobacter soli]|uniref:hypothetical protein n=1 Tax=Peristeroidobacter soli TaxID=2497877 RepID=UPI00101C6C6D|nr:hypothetical protein [Peristeroidobacter soli]
MPTAISSQPLTQATAGAAGSDIVQVKDGKIATARQSFFGRMLRFIPSGARATRERQAQSDLIAHALLVDLKQRFDGNTAGGEDIAETAMRMVGLSASGQLQDGRGASITVRQIRDAHAYAKMLSDQAKHSAALSAATLAATSYSPVAPGFDKFAREQAGIDPERLTQAQRGHYQYMLQRHVAIEPGKYVANGEALQKLATHALRYVSNMSDAQIETAQNDTLAQRDAAAAVLADLTSGAGMSSLVANLDRLHDASHVGIVDAMLGDTEYGAFMTLDSLALERAAAALTPQQAREAYFKAMANDGPGRAALAALDEKADELGQQSRQATDVDSEMQLELGARRARELHSTAQLVLQALGKRGGVENVEQQVRDASGKGAERTKAASSARAVVGSRVDAAAAKELKELQLRATALNRSRVSEGEGILIPADDEQLRETLQKEDRIPARQGQQPLRSVTKSGDAATEFFGNGFYQDVNRMHVILQTEATQARIGTVAPSDRTPTEEEKHAAKLEGLERLVEFVGDEALAARVTRLVSQKLFVPMSLALEDPNCPVQLPDGTHGQVLPVEANDQRTCTLSKTSDGEISVHVEQNYAARAVATPDGVRELDAEHSHLRMSYDFSITRDDVRATSPVTYDFRFAEAR